MKTRLGIIAIATMIVIVSTGVVLTNYNPHGTMKTIQFIEGRIKSGGTIVGYDQPVCVESAEDLGWWKKGGNWYVMYDKLQLEFAPGQLEDQKFPEQVGRTGLDIRGDFEGDNPRFYWYGTGLEE